MKPYPSIIDAIYGGILWIIGCFLIWILLSTGIYFIHILFFIRSTLLPHLWGALFSFLIMIAAIGCVRHYLFHPPIPVWAYVWLLISTLVCSPHVYIWFSSIMHDIALCFDSHGRWGCVERISVGSHIGYKYWIRDNTVAWTFFITMVLSPGIHWSWYKIRHYQAPSQAGKSD